MSVVEVRPSRVTLVDELRRINEAEGESGRGSIERISQMIDAGDKRAEEERREREWGKIESDLHEPREERRASPEYCASFEKYVRFGKSALSDAEVRALSSEDSTKGGALITPMQLVDAVISYMNTLAIRQTATRFVLSEAHSLGVPSVDADIDDSDWTFELGTGQEDLALRFGRRELHPHPLAKRIKCTNKVLQRAKGAEALVVKRLAYKLSVTAERAYLNGHGSKQPLGLFTASASGISTARDVSSGNAATSIGVDGLYNALYSLKEGYLANPSLRWVFHRDAVKQIRLLKDATDKRYLLEPSTHPGQPDKLLGVSVMLSEYAPNTFTSGLYVGIVGAMDHYHIADAEGVMIQRLGELYSLNDQSGFIARLETDGTPVLEEAFARVKLG